MPTFPLTLVPSHPLAPTSLLKILFQILSWYPQSESEFKPLQSIQLGCIEWLSIAVSVTFSKPVPPTKGGLGDVVECILEYLTALPGPYATLLEVEQTDAIRICMANVLTTRFLSFSFSFISFFGFFGSFFPHLCPLIQLQEPLLWRPAKCGESGFPALHDRGESRDRQETG